MAKVLHLTLKKKWFDMIASGEKKEEYRDLKRYWFVRLCMKDYDVVKFTNGYSKGAPTITFRIREITVGPGLYKWGAAAARRYFKIKLGEQIKPEAISLSTVK